MILYALDVDHTLEVSAGPITIDSVRGLAEKHIVGICGNWAVLTRTVSDWHRFVSFIGPMAMTKPVFLAHLRAFIPADDYVMVGNAPRYMAGISDDEGAARQAGWRFILERDFASGAR